jgi:hypothetical protein
MLRRSLEQLNLDNDYTTNDLHPCFPYSSAFTAGAVGMDSNESASNVQTGSGDRRPPRRITRTLDLAAIPSRDCPTTSFTRPAQGVCLAQETLRAGDRKR